MATIKFKGKIEVVRNADNTIAYRYLPVPKLAKCHCDMHAFRQHPKFGAYANSDLFPGILNRIRTELLGGKIGLHLDNLPPNVKVNDSGFLAVCEIEV